MLNMLKSITTKKERIAIICCLLLTVVSVPAYASYKAYKAEAKEYEQDVAEADKHMQEYDAMRDSVVVLEDDDESDADIARRVDFTRLEAKKSNEVSSNVSDSLFYTNSVKPEEKYDTIDFDKESVKVSDSEDIAGWLYVPGTHIDYIVMRGTADNDLKYLWQDPYGHASKTGSLFIRYGGDDGSDDHMVIYGHRLKNHKLYFGELLDYRNEAFAREHDKAYFYTKDGTVTEYYLRTVNEGLETDMIYSYPFKVNTSGYDMLIEDLGKTQVHCIEEIDNDREMLVLSTCSGDHSNMPDRLYLIFQKERVEQY